MPPTKRNKGIQIQNDAQPGNGTTPATSESANLPEVDEEQAGPGIPGMRPSEPPSATTAARTRKRNVRKHNTTNWSREEKKIIYLCFQIAQNEQWGRGKMKEIFMEQLRRSEFNQ